jgi:ABC-type Fe3+/spermidine/putrescine transport system ATPase subunit
MTKNKEFVKFDNVDKSYDGKVLVVKGLNLDIEEGEFVTMLGPSGSGKTTCLMMLAGFETPTHGEIYLDGKVISNIPPHKRGIGMVFQNYALFPHMTVYENLAFPLRVRKIPKDEADKKIDKALSMVSLHGFEARMPMQLSGGQQQRVAVARSLVFDPQVVLMDEPLGALDALTRGNLQDEILNIWGKDKRTALLITNDVDEGIYMADRIIPLRPGPNATLGPEFKIDIERPRDKTEMNDNANFKETRNAIIEYLMDIGDERKSEAKAEFVLPDLSPKDFVNQFK